jgi:hypothetical protein
MSKWRPGLKGVVFSKSDIRLYPGSLASTSSVPYGRSPSEVFMET